jgi:hypothetical protein
VAEGQGDQSGGERDEDRKERIDRELLELLHELRVALPGVQVLFAFLLAVPFAQGFATATDFQRDLFFVTLSATAVSSVFLIAPSAWHRLRFRQKDKERMLRGSNVFAIVGLLFLALAMVGAVILIADYLFGYPQNVIAGACAAALFACFWALVPLSGQND